MIIIKSKFTFGDLRNENNKGVTHKCSRKNKCALKVNLKPSDSFHSSLTYTKYATKCSDKKHFNTLTCSTSNCIHLITWFIWGLEYGEETVQSLRDRFSGHRAGMKILF